MSLKDANGNVIQVGAPRSVAALNDLYQADLRYTDARTGMFLGINSFHYRVSKLGTSGLHEDAAEACYNAVYDCFDLWEHVMYSRYVWENTIVHGLTDQTFRWEKEENDPGNVGGAPYAPQLCAVVKKHTNERGRRYRGRWYVPGLQFPSSTFPPQITGTLATVLKNGGEAAMSGKATDGTEVKLGIVSRATDPWVFTDVTAISVNPLIGTRRPRRDRFRPQGTT